MSNEINMETGQPLESGKKKGCAYYGCLFAAILTVLLGVVTVFAFYQLKEVFEVVNENLEDSPREMVSEIIPPEEFGQARRRFRDFADQLEDNQATELRLSSDDINAFLQHESELKELRDHLVIDIRGDIIRGDFSLPIMDKYLNGSGEISITFENNELEVYLKSLEVNDKKVDNDFILEIMKKNLAEEWTKDPEVQDFLASLSVIRVEDGKLVLKSK